MRSRTTAIAMGCAALLLAGTAEVKARADAHEPLERAPRLKMVSLGDSYSAGYTRLAGEPAEPDAPGKSGCEQTLGSYPYVVKRQLASRLATAVNVTCGGATTDDVRHTPQTPTGHARLDRFATPHSDPLAPFPARPAQIRAVSADTDVITVGIGGNDYFGPLASLCLKADSTGSRPAQCQDNLKSGTYAVLGLPANDPDLDGHRRALAAHYQALLGELHTRAPHARIYTVGYPTVIPEDVRTCARSSQELFTLNPGDLVWLRRILDGVNAAIASATARANQQGVPAQFVDTQRATVGRDACAARDVKWVEGYTEKAGTVGSGGWGEPALIHPNRRYHRYVAEELTRRIRHDFPRPAGR
ncbi:SGNH/GDSL hydrolase family protein [Streptomyces sp. NPDC048192]|uniref:SGNH/GDSL hydrolase family protein n=1 Tax=Streptomyces sp. NPDC048192 TaxID=3365510 RepID=UPI00371C5A47